MPADTKRLDWIARRTDEKRETYTALSDEVWELAELRFQEHGSVAAQIAVMEREGFTITRDVAGIPTAFLAEAGSGGPILGFLGEYDALAGLSQEAGAAEPKAVVPGAAGQGCGHNLLGAGSMLAAVLVKEYLEANGLQRARSATTAAPARRAARARRSWPARAPSTTWTRPSAGTAPRSTA